LSFSSLLLLLLLFYTRYPHYPNMFKYASALTVSIYGFYNPSLRHDGVWVMAFFSTTFYQFLWDIWMDWGLVEW